MSDVFGREYAQCYDFLYDGKDYAAECDLIERLFQAHGDHSISSVVDLGCGTGNHAFPICRRGYEVLGVERSESMLAHARQKLSRSVANGKLAFEQGDIRTVDLGRRFDAALMMFAVLGYQLGNEDVLAALRTARRHLRSGGLLIFDVWYGPAVLHQRPSERVKVTSAPDGRLLKFAWGEIAARRNTCKVGFHIWRLAGGRLLAEAEETHVMRYFFPLELDLFLECSGFKPVRLGAFPDFEKDPDETTWNCLVVAQAAGETS